MSEPTSRQALEEAVARVANEIEVQEEMGLDASEVSFVNDLLAVWQAARAILDAPPLEWCESHESKMWQKDLRPEFAVKGECERAVLIRCVMGFDDPDPCQFATYVRVKVGP